MKKLAVRDTKLAVRDTKLAVRDTKLTDDKSGRIQPMLAAREAVRRTPTARLRLLGCVLHCWSSTIPNAFVAVESDSTRRRLLGK